jgi:peptidoglycan hydrolase-like protein with peptidoglycan-binding domain
VVDAKVLQAQQWVNATYGTVAGYVKCPEDGKTAWSVMYSLTMGLQHELGITALSANFGPATLAALGAGVPISTTNQNIIKIIQSGCFCKGYNAGDIDGNFGSDTEVAVSTMMENAGLPDGLEQVVTPKVMKALLSMDAYVVLAGGSADVRTIQQWLNGRYLNRRDFFISPCDGLFSRGVETAMIYAIQYELGMADGVATGAFGPATQAGLRSHTVKSGDTGVWVSLFSAAMVFNGYGSFTDTFSSDLATSVTNFQQFSQLTASGQGDFATWAELLVSTGDPTRPGTACDCITTITPAIGQALFGAGYRIVGRYLDERGTTLDKKIKPGELETIFAAGLNVLPISQYYGGEAAYFTHAQGYTDAVDANTAALGFGFNPGTVIYFAVDYDATQADIDAYIVPYFQGIVAGLAAQGTRFVHGVYGSRNVCAQVTSRTDARWSFVSGMSTGFSGNMGFPLPDNWAFNQIQTLTVGSGAGAVQIDKDVHNPKADPGVSSINSITYPADGFVDFVSNLYVLAVAYGKVNPNLLVMQYLRQLDPKYTTLAWFTLIGDVDRDFVSYAQSNGVISGQVQQYADPFYGNEIDVAHFGASANGQYISYQPTSITDSTIGDVTAWGGDLMTFYGEWRANSDSYSSGYTYCQERLAKIDGGGTFRLSDLIEDADSYNVVKSVLGGGDVSDVVNDYYRHGGYGSRFKQFFQGRFGGTSAGAAAAANAILLSTDPAISVPRLGLIQSTGGVYTVMPNVLPTDKLDEFCNGFGDVLQARVEEEQGT